MLEFLLYSYIIILSKLYVKLWDKYHIFVKAVDKHLNPLFKLRLNSGRKSYSFAVFYNIISLITWSNGLYIYYWVTNFKSKLMIICIKCIVKMYSLLITIIYAYVICVFVCVLMSHNYNYEINIIFEPLSYLIFVKVVGIYLNCLFKLRLNSARKSYSFTAFYNIRSLII